ncbi:glycosyltransferase [Thermoplasmatales archaeon AK]|nr:glycosyltransferase [Thermoplasmatales archaeon AK]
MSQDPRKNLTILLFSAHPPIDSEIMAKWLQMGHTVYKISAAVGWDNEYSDLDKRVLEMIPKSKPDVIVCGSLLDAYFALLLKLLKKWIGTKISFIHWWFPPKNPLLYFVRNISVCEYERRYLRSLLRINSGVVYCPVDVEHFRALPVPKRKRAITIGNGFKTRSIMGYDHLLKIITTIHNRSPDIELSVFGINNPSDFPDYVEVRALKKEELLVEINKASCVFFTTTKNLIMNSLQIAMAAESNVVAFDLEPLKEVIEDGVSGYLIKLGEDDVFANRVIEVSGNYNREMGERARQSIVNKCESGLVAGKILDLTINRKNL